VLLLAVGLGVTAGCATQQAASKGEEAYEHSNWDAAVYHYLEALARDPENVEYRMALIRARQNAAQQHFKRGMALRELGQLTAARDELRLAVQLDPTHQFAAQELKQLEAELEILSSPDGAQRLEELKKRAREAKVKPPILDPTSDEPITLNFPKPKPVKEIYQAMAKAYGFNVLFDPKLKDDKLSIELRDVNAQEALEIVMRAAGHFYKVHDEHTIIIAEDTPQMRREYEDLVIKTFFLSNADVKDVDKLLRSLIEARRLSTNEQLNSITLRDTADKVAIAERLIDTNDKAKAEVLVDVELLQINTSTDSNIGMNLSSYSYSLSLDDSQVEGATGDGGIFLPDVENIFNNDYWFIAPIPDVIINLVKSSGEAQTLAQPQLRISEGEKGSLVIGDSVPIPVTSFNTSNTAGGNVVPITSFQYRDVGIKIDVEPRVHHNREVTLKLSVEVSQLGEEVSVGPNQSAVAIGTRNITSVIRLQDGETSLMAGLLRVDESDSRSETPGLSKIPLLGRLFTNKKKSKKTTDLVLTLTPHIIRFPDIAEEDLAPVWVGTESRISYFGSSSPQVASGRADEGPFDATGDAGGEQEIEPNAFGLRRPPSPSGETDDDGRMQPDPGSFGPGHGRVQIPRPQIPRPGSSGENKQGVELVPEGAAEPVRTSPDDGRLSHYGWPSDGSDLVPGVDPSSQLVRVSLEPSVVSLRPGEETVLQVMVAGGDGSIRLPLSISFDSQRVEVVGVESAPDVTLAGGGAAVDRGRLDLDLLLAESGSVPRAVAALRVRGLEQGPTPLVVSADSAVDDQGSRLPVAADDGAVYVLSPVSGEAP
jgi:general secretion pathway protein D